MIRVLGPLSVVGDLLKGISARHDEKLLRENTMIEQYGTS